MGVIYSSRGGIATAGEINQRTHAGEIRNQVFLCCPKNTEFCHPHPREKGTGLVNCCLFVHTEDGVWPLRVHSHPLLCASLDCRALKAKPTLPGPWQQRGIRFHPTDAFVQGLEDGSAVDISFLLIFLLTSKVVPGSCGLCALFQHLVTRVLLLARSCGGGSSSSTAAILDPWKAAWWNVGMSSTGPIGREPPACPAATCLAHL